MGRGQRAPRSTWRLLRLAAAIGCAAAKPELPKAAAQDLRPGERWVSCGGHSAPDCSSCARGNGAAWCNGECVWKQNRCVLADAAAKAAEDHAATLAREAVREAVRAARAAEAPRAEGRAAEAAEASRAAEALRQQRSPAHGAPVATKATQAAAAPATATQWSPAPPAGHSRPPPKTAGNGKGTCSAPRAKTAPSAPAPAPAPLPGWLLNKYETGLILDDGAAWVSTSSFLRQQAFEDQAASAAGKSAKPAAAIVCGRDRLQTAAAATVCSGRGLAQAQKAGEGAWGKAAPGAVAADARESCADGSEQCGEWAGLGECATASAFMQVACPWSCGLCTGSAAPPAAPKAGGADGAEAQVSMESWHNKSLWATTLSEREWNKRAQGVRDAFLHAWHGYCLYAWGSDELRPDSRKGHNTYGTVGMTILDSLTTLWLLDVPGEFERAAAFAEEDLRFGLEDRRVSVFELTIRALGGLLGAHALSGRPGLLRRAAELAERLLPAFNTSSGLPHPHWSLAPGGQPPPPQHVFLADAGSLQLEWRYLSQQTGDPRFGGAADAAFAALQASGLRGLLPVHFTPPDRVPPRPVRSEFALGGRADSYYEYLLKQRLLGPEEGTRDFRDRFLAFMEELPELLRPRPGPAEAEGEGGSRSPSRHTRDLRYRVISLDASGRPIWKMEHLSCFVPGVIALALLTLSPKDPWG